MQTKKTYYDILGLGRNASDLQIKRRYRQLVRKYHPDVASDKAAAHQVFIQITEAYEALTDPMRRRAYDATLDMEAKRRAEASKARAAARTASTQRPPGQYVRDAQFAFIHRRFNEAISKCQEALKIDPTNAQAHAVLGDVYRALGRVDHAVRAYTYALQFNPADRDSERKLTELVGKHVRHGGVDRRALRNPARVAALNMMGWSVAFFFILLLNAYPGKPVEWFVRFLQPVSLWSWNLVGCMAGASAVMGILLAVNGLVNHPDEELLYEHAGSTWSFIPAGAMLSIFSLFFFAGAAVFYILVGLLQGSLSRSVLISFVAVAVVVLLSALTYSPAARMQVLTFGGNVSFLSLLVGWYIGSLFRPLGTA